MRSTIILASNLTKRYGARMVVDGIDFEIRQGECFGFLGPNGAGKSTTMRMITGLTPRDGGRLEILGRDVVPEDPLIAAQLGIVPQENNLDTDLGVAENLEVYCRYFGMPARARAERIEHLLEFAQLSDRRDAPVRILSGGMMRRLVIARALVAQPRMVILDEPTTGLDPQARHLIWQRLASLKERGVTLLLTTHYMEEASRLCDRLLILDQGRILDQGTPEALIAKHVEPEVLEVWTHKGCPDPNTFGPLPGRLERVGDVLYVHGVQLESLRARVRQRDGYSCLLRPANLEDVFLRLTGHDLGEGS
ncbi:MAG: ATP-binding cassette domain-containing protein [Magnetococcales bacterium]|nr:ATP-binding cassette domain-containing protein [Magnetococcales bacterium]MBF0151077.1 ATP-binding cassette domain-containing protein [Magnetococcales bacterium]MBF0174659.1 ATP-binding cassette domain-containing protein [Magnetococcales bacterium]MBF0348606.1 ATP-binding cassette domain-containing protein [Magnetococcales bacterium]MBF0630064.1 ATP-binding cassette domain-containing protein [Magnetococcales bacterium]